MMIRCLTVCANILVCSLLCYLDNDWLVWGNAIDCVRLELFKMWLLFKSKGRGDFGTFGVINWKKLFICLSAAEINSHLLLGSFKSWQSLLLHGKT